MNMKREFKRFGTKRPKKEFDLRFKGEKERFLKVNPKFRTNDVIFAGIREHIRYA
jgi:hypothetical protein